MWLHPSTLSTVFKTLYMLPILKSFLTSRLKEFFKISKSPKLPRNTIVTSLRLLTRPALLKIREDKSPADLAEESSKRKNS